MPVAGIVNIKKDSEYDVYIGRNTMVNSKWGNPYKVGIHYPRGKCIKKFEGALLVKILRTKEVTYEDLLSLSGKVLGCFCKPKPCHGDVIARYVEYAETFTKAEFTKLCWEYAKQQQDAKIRLQLGLPTVRSSVGGN